MSASTPVLLRSGLLTAEGFAHGFSLRTGGVSVGAFASLNLARTVGDDADHVAENHRRFADAVGYPAVQLFEVSQVHGARVRTVKVGLALDETARDETALDPAEVRREEADALVTDSAAVAVRVADCVPVLLASRRTGAVAAVHAGWRGTVAGVLPAALDSLAALDGSRPTDVVAAIGPHIRVASFEVGEEVAQALAHAAPAVPVVHREGYRKPHVDLSAIVRHQLLSAGLDDAAIDDIGGCTFEEAERFFSHRRDRGQTGRHLAAIVGRR